MTDLTTDEAVTIRNSYLKTQVPWGDKEQYVICKVCEIDAAIRASYNVARSDAEFERMMDA